jgi:molybdopterin molybdotransferase
MRWINCVEAITEVFDARLGAMQASTPWDQARQIAYGAGASARRAPIELPLTECDGATLAADLVALSDLPAFPTSSIDGWAVRGPAPWRIVGRILAGDVATPLGADGVCAEIATGAMVPADAEAVLRIEESAVADSHVTGVPRAEREWRDPGDEAQRGEVLLPAGTPVTPGVIGLAAACGYDTLSVTPRPRAAMLVFGDELLSDGPPSAGRIRDSLGPQIPSWLARLGCEPTGVRGPIEDSLGSHVAALRSALADGVDLIATTGGTMHGPVDHLHPALARLGASYAVNTVEVRPGFPMLLATVARDGGVTVVAGLPGNPQSAVVALMSLAAPALAGMRGAPLADLATIELGATIPGRGGYTHLALVSRGAGGVGMPVSHVGSAMLRGLAQAAGFAVIPPGTNGEAGARVPFLPLPVVSGETP